jgi:hypothetical protein
MGDMIEESERRFFNDYKELWLSKAFQTTQNEFRIRDRDNMKLPPSSAPVNISDSRVARQKFLNLNEEFTKLKISEKKPEDENKKKFEGDEVEN